jgi:hypothetical protein
VNIDHGQLVGRHLNRFAIVMDLNELAPVDRRATGRRDGRTLERLAGVDPSPVSVPVLMRE